MSVGTCRSSSSTSSPSHSRDGVAAEASYVEYLHSARTSVQNCANACCSWSAPYDGENPTVESFLACHVPAAATISEERKAVVPVATVVWVIDRFSCCYTYCFFLVFFSWLSHLVRLEKFLLKKIIFEKLWAADLWLTVSLLNLF